MKPNLKLVEAKGDDITFTFGRFNPPTIGHEKLMDATKKAATKEYRVYASKSQDAKKNPLQYEQKVKWMKRMFPKHKSKIQSGGNYRTALDVAVPTILPSSVICCLNVLIFSSFISFSVLSSLGQSAITSSSKSSKSLSS